MTTKYEQNGVTYLNPGSASYPKSGNPGSAAFIYIEEDRFGVKLIRLKN
jgi:predicted phosphodiesterase